MEKHCIPAAKREATLCKNLLWAGALALATVSLPASAVEGVIFAGNGNAVDALGINVRTDPLKTWTFQNGGSAVVLGEAEIAYWHGKEAQVPNTNTNRSITEIGFKPVLRYYPLASDAFRPYLEAGLGMHLLSHTRINQERQLPTAFEFGEILGLGVQFCPRLACSVAVRLQHVSNAGIKQPNNGITFSQASFGYRF
ncbi:MAG: acyloxyacyl hydrolase [Rhodocyclaceae bacterium]|nr:acyloxyacyl hydrolase [Rhodocyclaceae bacterium]